MLFNAHQRHEGRRLPHDRQADCGESPVRGIEPDDTAEAEKLLNKNKTEAKRKIDEIKSLNW